MALTKNQKIAIVKEALLWKSEKIRQENPTEYADELLDWMANMIVEGDFQARVKQFAQTRKAELQAIVDDNSGDIAPNTKTAAQTELAKYDTVDKEI